MKLNSMILYLDDELCCESGRYGFYYEIHAELSNMGYVMQKNPAMSLRIWRGLLCSSGRDQRTPADPGHSLHLRIAFADVQEFHGMSDLGGDIILRLALREVGILPGNDLSGLDALHDHAPPILSKG